MSLSNLLKDNNYDVHVESLSIDGGSQLNTYVEGTFQWAYEITNNAPTGGSFTVKYVKCGKVATLAIKQFSFTVTNPGYLVMTTGLPSILYPETFSQTGGLDYTGPTILIYKQGDPTATTNYILYINGASYAPPETGYITSNDFNTFEIAAGTYDVQQMSVSYVTVN